MGNPPCSQGTLSSGPAQPASRGEQTQPLSPAALCSEQAAGSGAWQVSCYSVRPCPAGFPQQGRSTPGDLSGGSQGAGQVCFQTDVWSEEASLWQNR